MNADYTTAHQWYGEDLISLGRFNEAKAETKRALELDPVSLAINIAQGFPYYYNREYDEAITAYKKALELDPKYAITHWRLNQVYIWLEKAYQGRSYIMVDLKVEPVWDFLRSDPRFADLLRRMRLSD